MAFNKLRAFLQHKKIKDELIDYYLRGSHFRIPPKHLLFITTKRCNSHCIMCNIWRNKDFSEELSKEEFTQIIENRLFRNLRTITFSGGEPTLRPDLEELVSISLRSLPELEYVGLASNGLAPNLLLRKVARILELLQEAPEVELVVQLSLDSVDETHDKVRGVLGAFDSAKKAIDGLSKLREKDPSVILTLSCVISPANIGGLENLYEFSKENKWGIIFSPAIISDYYYKNTGSDVGLSEGDKKKAIMLLNRVIAERKNINSFYYQKVVIPILEGGTRSRKCMMGVDAIVLEADGSIPFCINAESFSGGNIKQEKPEEIWYKGVKEILANKEVKRYCSKCAAACGLGGYTISEAVQLYKEMDGTIPL